MLAPVDKAQGDDEIVDAATVILGLGVARTKSQADTDAATATAKASVDTRAKSVQRSCGSGVARLTGFVCLAVGCRLVWCGLASLAAARR